ncbi:MAG: hypothetical protein GXP23_10010 [Gammaproteobacteria bacterium]|nr:hypothetical protein [Gammaproteobacteria bacterium]
MIKNVLVDVVGILAVIIAAVLIKRVLSDRCVLGRDNDRLNSSEIQQYQGVNGLHSGKIYTIIRRFTGA